MSINLTQEFVYETDCLDSFDTVLCAALKVMMAGPNDQYRQLWLRTEKPMNYSCRDHYSHANVLKIGDKWCVVAPEKVYHGATIAKITSEHDTQEEACKTACHYKEPGPSRLFVCMAGNRKYGMQESDQKFDSHEQLVWEILCKMRHAAKSRKDDIEMLEHWDDNGDGSMGLGYRIHTGFGDELYFSMVKIYYSK